jgi:sugar phosphate isomerase/epimerase
MSRNIYPFAINTYSYTLSHTAKHCLTHLANQDYTDFELMMYPGHLWPADLDKAARDDLRRHIAEHGLRVVTLNMPNIDLNVAGAAEEMRSYTLDLLDGVVELAGDLNVPGVIIGPGKANPLLPAPKDRLMGYFFAALDRLAPLAEKVGTRIYVENMPFAFLPDADSLMAALDDYGNDDIGVVYDVANGVFIDEDPAEGLRRVQKRLRLVHLSDTSRSVYRHDPVGLGVVPFADIPQALHAVGHDELPMLEIISQNADRDIRDSAEKLFEMGWPRSLKTVA